MLGIIFSLLGMQNAADNIVHVSNLKGNCQYSEAVIERRADTVLAICDQLTIESDEESAQFDFARSDGGVAFRFSGPMSGNRMTVQRVYGQSSQPVSASGTCEVFYANGKISVVSCLATAGAQSYAANFIPSPF